MQKNLRGTIGEIPRDDQDDCDTATEKLLNISSCLFYFVVQYLPLSKGSDRYVMDRACCFTCNNFSFSKTPLNYHITFISSELIFFMKNYVRFP